MTKPLIIRPFGMSAEVCARIIEALDNDDETYIDDWCREDDSHQTLLQKLKVYRTPGEIASFSKGYHDAIARTRPAAYWGDYRDIVNTVPDKWCQKEGRQRQPKGWDPKSYIEGWERAGDKGSHPEGENTHYISHYRFTTVDGGNGCIYVREMTFNKREGNWFQWSRILDYTAGLAPNSIDHMSIDYLNGRTMCGEVLELRYPGFCESDHEVGFIRVR